MRLFKALVPHRNVTLSRQFSRSRKIIIGIGVTLCVAPFFSNAMAQSSDQARMLMEMQALRQEIAELRDMVERQQYRLNKLQQAGTVGSNPGPAYPTDPASNTASGNGFPTTAGVGSSSAPVGADASTPNYPPQAGGQRPTGDGGFYRPDGDAANGSAIESATGAPVSSTVITAPPAGSNSNFPPVVDRSVGGQGGPTGATTPPNPDFAGLPQSGNPQASDLPTGQVNVDSGSGYEPSRPGVISVPSAPTGQGGAYRPQNQGAPQGLPPQSTAAIPATISEKEYYLQGFELLKQSKHEQAVSVFKQQIEKYAQGEYADDAYYWIAESMYVNRNLDVSKQNFKKIIESYKQSPRLPDAMLKTAYIEQEQGNLIEARILLQEIMQFHPRSNAAISAKNRLAELK